MALCGLGYGTETRCCVQCKETFSQKKKARNFFINGAHISLLRRILHGGIGQVFSFLE